MKNNNFCTVIDKEQARRYADNIVGTIEYLSKETERLHEENKRLKTEHYKDEEINKLSQENKELKKQLCAAEIRNEFVLTEDEEKRISDWQNKHNERKHLTKYFGAAGGELTYLFTPTGIGTFGTVKCACGEKYEFRKP